MADLLVREIADNALTKLARQAKARGRTLEDEVRDLIERHAASGRITYTPEQRAAISRGYLDRYPAPLSAMTLDEMRDGLE